MDVLELIDEREAARRLGVSVRTLQSWRLRREGPPFVKLGRSIRYDPAVLERHIRAATIEPAPVAARAGAGGA